jgi:Ankyrin repeat
MRRWRGDDVPSDPLPARPDLDQLRRRAKELRDAARVGDPAALSRIAAHAPVSASVTLAAAQLTIAREHGFVSWPRLRAEAQARNAELAQRVEEFLVASIRDWTGRAARMLARDPQIASYDFRTAVVLGDAARVRAMLGRDPALATRPDARTGWTALHAVCSSRWHRIDPGRAAGLTEVARLLLDAGADPGVKVGAAGRPDDPDDHRWSPLFCAVTGASNPDITRLLLERGARPDSDDMLYLAAFDSECLRLLLPYAPDIAHTMALSAPLSTGDVTGVKLLLGAGADPNLPFEANLLGESYGGAPPCRRFRRPSHWTVRQPSSLCSWPAAPTPALPARTAAPPTRWPSATAKANWPGYWPSTVLAPTSPPAPRSLTCFARTGFAIRAAGLNQPNRNQN